MGSTDSSSAPSDTRIALCGFRSSRILSSCSEIFLSARIPTFLSPAIETISTSLFSEINSSYTFIPPNMVLISESSGSAEPSLTAASRFALRPIIGLGTPAFSPRSLSRSIQMISILIGIVYLHISINNIRIVLNTLITSFYIMQRDVNLNLIYIILILLLAIGGSLIFYQIKYEKLKSDYESSMSVFNESIKNLSVGQKKL